MNLHQLNSAVSVILNVISSLAKMRIDSSFRVDRHSLGEQLKVQVSRISLKF